MHINHRRRNYYSGLHWWKNRVVKEWHHRKLRAASKSLMYKGFFDLLDKLENLSYPRGEDSWM